MMSSGELSDCCNASSTRCCCVSEFAACASWSSVLHSSVSGAVPASTFREGTLCCVGWIESEVDCCCCSVSLKSGSVWSPVSCCIVCMPVVSAGVRNRRWLVGISSGLTALQEQYLVRWWQVVESLVHASVRCPLEWYQN